MYIYNIYYVSIPRDPLCMCVLGKFNNKTICNELLPTRGECIIHACCILRY